MAGTSVSFYVEYSMIFARYFYFVFLCFCAHSATSDSKKRRDQDVQKISIWPEWTESELAAEKWVGFCNFVVCIAMFLIIRKLLGAKVKIRKHHYLE